MDATAAAVAAVLLVLAVLLLVSRRAASYASGSRLPPGPMALPLIGHLHLISSPPHRALDRILARYGPLVYLRLGPSTHCVVAGTADAARDLLKFEASIPERPLTAVTRHLAYDDAGFAFAPYGPHWRFMKRLCMSELLGPRTVDQLRPVREAELAAVLGAARDAAGRGEAIDVSRQLISMSNNAIMRMVASALPGHMTEAARDCAKHVAEVVGAFNVEDYVALCRGWDLQGLMRRTREVRDKFDALLEIMITAKEEARAGRSPAPAAAPPTKDLLDILMDAAEDQNAEFKLTRENIDQGLRPRHLHRWFRHDRHQRGVDAVASHQPPGLHGQAARRAGRRRGRVAAGGRAGRRQAPLPAGRLQGDTPAAAAGRVRAAGDHRAGARPRLHHPAQDLHLLQHLLHRPRPWLVGGAPPVPTGALHARRRRRHRRPQGPAHAAHAVRERPPRLPRHGPRYAGRASVPRRAGAVLRLGGAHPSGSLKGAAAGHGRGGRPCRRPEAPAPAHPDPTLQSTARTRLASNATTTLPARQYLF